MKKKGKQSNSITIDEVIENFKSLYSKTTNTNKKTVLTQKDITRFERVWKREFISYRGRYRKKHIDTKKETEYKNCLFTIFTKHWDEVDGFQINMENVGTIIGKSDITVNRMILFFMRTGIINRCHNYYVGKQTYFYHKNSELFNYLYKSKCNDYYIWILNNKNNVNNYIYNNPNVFTNKKNVAVNNQSKQGRKRKTYTEDYSLLSKIEKEFLPIIDKLNKKQHDKLQINFGLRFNKHGNYTGRSTSFFCYTLNENKKHTFDNTMIPRSLFMKNVGLTGYKQVYDIKSEVPRTTILCNTGIWRPDSYDFYTEVVKESHPLEVSRGKIKELYMRFNFDIGTDKELFSHYRRSRIFTIGHEHGLKYTEAMKIYDTRLENDEEYTFDEWVLLKNVINKIQGKSWGNLIFWWTSLIQIKTVYETLKDTGIRIYNVYDGFYSPPEITKKYLVKTVKQSADYIYNKYIKKTPYPY